MKTLSIQPDGIARCKVDGVAKRHGVFLVENHPVTQAGFIALITREEDLFVCGIADSAAIALDQISKLKPSIIILDITLKTSSGLELLKNVVALCPAIPTLVISVYDESLCAERAIRAGARGYVMKIETVETIVTAIRVILRGDIYLSEQMKGNLLNNMVGNRDPELVAFPLELLSDRELEVFQLIGDGFSSREIASRLNLSGKTIDSYREHIKLKLNLKNGAELIRRAIRWARLENLVES
jgi:DNA-binding NarL/FixJ family response regulator